MTQPPRPGSAEGRTAGDSRVRPSRAARSAKPTTLLVNPPLWNAYAPHLAVPLLLASLRGAGWPARARDLSADVLDRLLSGDGLERLGARMRQRSTGGHRADRNFERARLVLPSAVRDVDEAKAVLRDEKSLNDHRRFQWATSTLRNALWVVSAAHPGLAFDLAVNEQQYATTSTAQVLAATEDLIGNPYPEPLEAELRDELAAPDLGLVAVSVSADTQLIAALGVARIVRRRRPDVRVVFGGNYVSRLVTRWTEPDHPFLDLVDVFVAFEGEEALPALCEAFFGGGSLEQVPGAVWREGGRLRRNPGRDADLTSLPCPDYTDYDLGRYFAPGPLLPLLASRSCAWNCSFCSIPFASNKFRMRTPSDVVDDMDELHRRHGAAAFVFVDEIMTLRSMRGVAEELVRRGRSYHWYAETRFANGWSRELTELLYASGCRRLAFGLESYNQRMLDLMRKEVRIDWVDRNIDALLGAGIPVHLFTILGFPGEVPEETARTVEFALETITRSREEFGNPYTTWGASPFVLDVHSPVARHPETYGVRPVEPPPEADLALSLDYTVTSGMSAEQSEAVAAEVFGQRSSSTRQWFHRVQTRDIEEFVFLRAAHEAGMPKTQGRPLELFRPPRGSDRVRLDPALCAIAPRAGFTAGGHPAALAVYDPRHDVVLTLAGTVGAGEPALPLGHRLAFDDLCAVLDRAAGADPADGTEHIACAMARYGMLQLPQPAAAFDSPAEAPDGALLVEEQQVVAEEESLHCLPTGKSLQLNGDARRIWAAVRDGGLQLGTLRAALGSDRARAAVDRFVLDLVRFGFAYLLDPSRPGERP
ncbi:radical SAM protein [Kitasatospora sp. GP82]|uniref:B12-binding domain-containing radical SAM protein n=1 Tax=Kitasatospora sp. GP82 TaxID=3035089 RepID=UPI002473F515|nr:radical SAM protein [Kitasatospora sp. GP82]MDH6126858.1 hypothetical protein [Kitasatospora sp. GP82]